MDVHDRIKKRRNDVAFLKVIEFDSQLRTLLKVILKSKHAKEICNEAGVRLVDAATEILSALDEFPALTESGCKVRLSAIDRLKEFSFPLVSFERDLWRAVASAACDNL